MNDKVNILVVDDLPDKRLAFRVVLEELEQNLVLVNSGADALRELLEREFAVIVLDVNMPDIDGIETAELIRQHPRTAHTPIIFVTAYADEMQTARGYALGAVDYIQTPVVPEILRSKVRVFVDLYRAQRRAQALAHAEAAREAAEEATRRSEFLSDATRELQGSLDIGEGMQRFLKILVPRFGETALLQIRLQEGEERVQWAGAVTEIAARSLLDEARQESRRFELALEIGPSRFGTLQLARQRADRHFREGELGVLKDLVSRAAIAFENGKLYWSLKREIHRSQQAEERLQEASRRKDEFLAMLSHELRNPLAPIRNAVEIIRRIAPADPGLTWASDVVERQVTHMAQLVEELLDVSRITQGKINLRKEAIELEKVLAHSVETVRSLFDARGHSLVLSLPATPVWLLGDFARLAQVFANLLNNAAKYTPEGGRIEVAASAEQGSAMVTVKDNGVGIDGELLPRVFDLFIQGERSLDRSQGGLGVGLTVVQRLVALHQGSVEAHSDGAGRGASFRVTLPCISEVSGHKNEELAPAKPPGHARMGRRVLVVDDNPDAAESIAVFLRLEGHEVRTVNDGAHALASAQVFAPQAAVIDIGLPGMNGYEVARRLQQMPEPPGLLIALTGYGQTEDRVRARQAGFHHHFVKPADPRGIQATIAQWQQRQAAGEQAPSAGSKLQ